MKSRTAKARGEYEAVYVTFTGGAAVLAAKAIKRVLGVEWLDLGIPEALWVFEVENFGPLTVSIDSMGRNYTEEVLNSAKAKRDMVLKILITIFSTPLRG